MHGYVNVNVPINQKEQHKPKIISNEISCCQVARHGLSAWSACASQCIFKNLMPTTHDAAPVVAGHLARGGRAGEVPG